MTSNVPVEIHQVSLLSRARCPGCAELLSARSLYSGAQCSHCGASTTLFGLSGKDVAQVFRDKAKLQVFLIAGFVALTYLMLGSAPLLGSLSLLVAAIWIKAGILYPVTRTFSVQRRIVTRWVAKTMLALFIVVTLVFCEVLTLVPGGAVAKSVIGTVQVAISAAIVVAYVTWQIDREELERPVGWWEWAWIGLLTLGVVVTAGASVYLAVEVAEWAEQLLESVKALLTGGLGEALEMFRGIFN